MDWFRWNGDRAGGSGRGTRVVGLAKPVVLSLAVGCVRTPAPPTVASAASDPIRTFSSERARWVHSSKLGLRFQLPDGRQWTTNPRSSEGLLLSHSRTESTLALRFTREAEPMSRGRCESRYGQRDEPPTVRMVEDSEEMIPEGFDARIWVGVETRRGNEIRGHLYLFGGRLRRCLVLHYETRASGATAERELASRLASMRGAVTGGFVPHRLDVSREAR